MSASANSSVKKKFNWLGALAWGAGSAIFGWLLAGVCYQRDYRYLTWGDLNGADWGMAFAFGGLSVLLAFGTFLKRNKTSAKSEPKSDVYSSDTFSRVLSVLLPALYLVLALAILVLTLATYNGDWTEARQGLATGFAALLAAVGAIISVYVTYKIGEENRASQKEIEDNKRDAETIKSLNDRLHNIIPRRNSNKEKEEEREKERISSYFQLAALYKDWDLLAENSEKIDKQKANQQKYILKLLFGAAEKDSDGKFVKTRTADEDIVLNAIISDLFISVENNNAENELYNGGENSSFRGYDLEYADLSHLNFYGKLLDNSDFSYAFLDGAHFVHSFLQGARFSDAYLDEARFDDAFLQGARFFDAYMDDAIFTRASLKGSIFKDASLEGASFYDASLEGASFNSAFLEGASFDKSSLERAGFCDAYLEGASFYGAKIFGKDQDEKYVLRRLARAEKLPSDEELLGIEGFTEEFLDELKSLHELQKENR